MTEPSADTVVHRLLRNAGETPDRIALRRRHDGTWQSFTWAQYADLVAAAARVFVARGLAPGQPVAIIAGNRLEWAIAALGALTAGGVVAGVYPTLTAEQTAYVVAHSGAPIAVVEDRAQLDKLRAQRGALPALTRVLVVDGAPAAADGGWAEGWETALAAAGTREEADAVAARVAGLRPDGLATLVYTSGTTGSPKGVMLSHHNLTWTADAVEQRLPPGLRPRLVSYLPLSHIAEQMVSLYLGISLVGEVWFAESLEKLRDNLLDCHPSVFVGVPRVWEKIASALAQRLAAAHGAKAALLRFARQAASDAWQRRQRGSLPPGLALRYRLARALVLDKVRAALGFDQTRVFISTAAPIARATVDFFASLDIPIFEVYGLSENSGPATQNNEQEFRLGTAGRPLPGVDLRLAADGEIQIRGGNVFQGYFRDPAATAEALQDGWLQSGDVGEIDADGYLRITDRKKDLLITAGGKNVAPQPIEQRLRAIPEVSQAVVIGDRRPYLVALLTLDPAAAARFVTGAGGKADDPAALAADPGLKRHIGEAIERINGELARYETIKRFAILPGELTLEGGELTPTMKIKRRVVTEKHAATIAGLYA